ncbi:MAG: hypothetical protein AB7O60_12150 [Variibacter sp.]
MRCVWNWRAPAGERACTCRIPGFALAALAVTALAGCVSDGGQGAVAQAPSGAATVAFESIDGPPPPVFEKMVDSLSKAAARRQLIIVSRNGDAAYRVRGYIAANVVGGRTHIDWVWDVYDVGRQRALRITGDEATNRKLRDAWAGADDAAVGRIAETSVERLAAFVGGPAVAPAQSVPGGALVAEAETVPAVAAAPEPPRKRARTAEAAAPAQVALAAGR